MSTGEFSRLSNAYALRACRRHHYIESLLTPWYVCNLQCSIYVLYIVNAWLLALVHIGMTIYYVWYWTLHMYACSLQCSVFVRIIIHLQDHLQCTCTCMYTWMYDTLFIMLLPCTCKGLLNVITPHGLKSLRGLINNTVIDVFYYMSSKYGPEVNVTMTP